ncbi:MAG TPA: Holliday junction resolvase [Thermoplasmata archaeon]|nr:Holliday junction resolvase [Thermoplasmata archaeon]
MVRGASGYERELKQLLQGDPESLRKYGASIGNGHGSVLARVRDHPFLVVRAAGSMGFDLVALRREFAFPIEVKASHSEVIHFTAASGRSADQLESHRRAVARVGLLAIYAYRRLGLRGDDPWRVYAPPAEPGRGRLELIRRRVPPIDATRGGNAVLRWESGLPLTDFLELVTSLVEAPGS